MNKKYGIVEKVYIPSEDKEEIFANKIGFIINIDNKLYKYEDEQDEDNIQILKNDKVVIIRQIVDNIDFIDIKKADGEDNE